MAGAADGAAGRFFRGSGGGSRATVNLEASARRRGGDGRRADGPAGTVFPWLGGGGEVVMSEKRDDSSEPNDLDARKRRTPPSSDAPASSSRDPKNFLPDDSFLLDLDDELLGPPAAKEGAASEGAASEGAASDDFLLVDDDLANAAAAAASAQKPVDLDADVVAPLASMAAELSPVEAWDDATAVAKRAAANSDAGAPDVVEPEAVEPTMADAASAASRPSLPSWATRDE